MGNLNLGKDQITVSNSSLGFTAANIPAMATFALISVEGASVRMGDATNVPTTSDGVLWGAGSVFVVLSHENIANIRFFREDAVDATVTARFGSGYDIPSLAQGSLPVQGLDISGAAVTGNPVRVGATAETGTRSAVDDGDAVEIVASANGILGTLTVDSSGSIGNAARVLRPNADGETTGSYALETKAALKALGPDGSWDRVRGAGDTAGAGLGALLTSPTGHAYNNVTGDEQILATAGKLHTITVGEVTTAGTLTVYDNTAESGTVIATLELPLVGSTNGLPYTLHFDVNCATGLYLGYDASLVGNVTVSYAD